MATKLISLQTKTKIENPNRETTKIENRGQIDRNKAVRLKKRDKTKTDLVKAAKAAQRAEVKEETPLQSVPRCAHPSMKT
jgi:hypothetical protein